MSNIDLINMHEYLSSRILVCIETSDFVTEGVRIEAHDAKPSLPFRFLNPVHLYAAFPSIIRALGSYNEFVAGGS